MDYPLTRLPIFYPGQLGVPGSDNELGLRNISRGKIIYADSGHGNANDANDGTNPDAPKLTVQGAVNAVSSWDVIIVRAMGVESVVTPTYADDVQYVRIVGQPAPGLRTPYWEGAAGLPCLQLNAPGWTVKGFRFGPDNGGSGVQLPMVGAPLADANAIPVFTTIEDCYFYGANDGAGDGLYGVDLYGGAYEVTIRNCTFEFFARAGGGAICVTDSSFANPYRQHIVNCLFAENIEHIDANPGGTARGFNSSEILNCTFSGRAAQPGASLTNQVTSVAIDLNGGNGNFVSGNRLGGIYRLPAAGEYRGGTNDFWLGNFANRATEAAPGTTIGPDCITIAPPAA